MRRLVWIAVLAFACGPVDTGSGSTGAGSGGGPVWTGGGGSPDADAGTPPASACDGLVPASNPPPRTVTVAHRNGEACWYFTSDAAGNVAAESHSNADSAQWQMWGADGSALGATAARFGYFGQSSGFAGVRVESGSSIYVRVSPAGAELSRTVLGAQGCSGDAYFSTTGGVVVVGGCPGSALMVTRFDDAGHLTATKPAGAAFTKKAVAIGDAAGATLVVIWPAPKGGAEGRWFDASLTPMTDWFSLPEVGETPLLRPFGGGVVLQHSNGAWVAFIATGKNGWTGPPDWLTAHPKHDVLQIRGGRGFALVPKYGAANARNQLLIYAADGEQCGTGTFPSDGLAVGMEGTVLGSSGDGGCSLTFWPGVLR